MRVFLDLRPPYVLRRFVTLFQTNFREAKNFFMFLANIHHVMSNYM